MSIGNDHIHIFLDHRPSQSIVEIIQYLEGASLRELLEFFPYVRHVEIHLISRI